MLGVSLGFAFLLLEGVGFGTSLELGLYTLKLICRLSRSGERISDFSSFDIIIFVEIQKWRLEFSHSFLERLLNVSVDSHDMNYPGLFKRAS